MKINFLWMLGCFCCMGLFSSCGPLPVKSETRTPAAQDVVVAPKGELNPTCSVAALGNCSSKIVANSCAYYLCAEENRKCGMTGYLLDFGYRYCETFLNMKTEHFSERGIAWLEQVRLGLQVAVDKMPADLSCDDLKQQAFAAHVPVYKETRFCDIPLPDRLRIYVALRRATLTNVGALRNGIDVLEECGVNDREELRKYEQSLPSEEQ